MGTLQRKASSAGSHCYAHLPNANSGTTFQSLNGKHVSEELIRDANGRDMKQPKRLELNRHREIAV